VAKQSSPGALAQADIRRPAQRISDRLFPKPYRCIAVGPAIADACLLSDDKLPTEEQSEKPLHWVKSAADE
jgi:hypothetical protein